jgi:hypothetical protein
VLDVGELIKEEEFGAEEEAAEAVDADPSPAAST